VLRPTRWHYWWQLAAIALAKPRLVFDYLIALSAGEHFFAYRHEVRAQLRAQLDTVRRLKGEASRTPLAARGDL
jgi:hypothetical protein